MVGDIAQYAQQQEEMAGDVAQQQQEGMAGDVAQQGFSDKKAGPSH